MEPLEALEIFHKKVREFDCKYALCGGLTAGLYREKVRTTLDVDIAIASENPLETAKELLLSLNLKVSMRMIYSGRRKIDNIIALVIGQFDKDDYDNTIDIFLPVLPWVEKAVERAQFHQVDFGFAKIPTISVEDLIIAKAFALEFEPNRFQDLDDLKSIFNNKNNSIASDYLLAEMCKYKLYFPEILDSNLPPRVRKLSKENRDNNS